MKLSSLCTKNLITCLISLTLILLGILLITSWSLLYDLIMKSNLVLTPTSTAYDIWKKNPLPLTIDFYFHNWTNPEAAHNSSEKFKFNQMGPYRFRETKEKSSIIWNSNNTVTYKHLKKWWFDEKNSAGSLDEMVTTINPIPLAASFSARDWNFIIKKGLSYSLKSMDISVNVTKTVGELLFEGYEDPLINLARKMPFVAGNNMPAMDRFGWFYGRNGSDDHEGTFNMDTGVNGTLGQLYEWKFAKKTNYYLDECNDIKGSAGEFFPQNLSKESIVTLFTADLCRPMGLEFQREAIIHNIIGYKYIAGELFLDNGTKFPENKCYCLGDCMPSGAVNVSACRYGSPAFVSLPHFHNGDPYYQDNIEGVRSDSDKHEFYMIFEPQTAVPLEVGARLQLNLLLQPIQGIELYADVPKVYFPVLWFEQVVRMPEDMAVYIKILLNFKIICYSIGIIAIFGGFLVQICFCYKLCNTKIFEKPDYEKEVYPLRDQNETN